MYDLDGRAALVTGAGKLKGIGRALALRLAAEGADVAVADVCKTEDDSDETWRGLNEAAAEIQKMGRKALVVNMNITDWDQVQAGVSKVRTELGGIRILCNNAGMAGGIGPAHTIKPEEWRRVIDINLNGTFLVSKAVVPVMQKGGRGGSIINTASWRGRHPARMMAAYNASKAAVILLTQTMALELAPMGIRVNAILPGKVDTDLERWGWNLRANAAAKPLEAVIKEETAKVPIGRIAMPEDIANAVAFLASDQAGYLTGLALYLTGGMEVFCE